ncbi:hypothetical protein E1A91_A08G174200v1 [Gossypium mustelinum]|uniref:Uncharacterized protein n=3 Tax=Gossypium TaxID=3633 RepID=A0A5J5UT40_GOSBA|nr:hypothetical protein ES319_A08G167200v1 [Gossypium barbadense]TYH06822.1 hypothetical protein ES288_A08G184000v1 [Gossypium darwinii]TYJ23190.1 hypothetical protein E1A91_A08G174200v1 [Gossypium mustelinum]
MVSVRTLTTRKTKKKNLLSLYIFSLFGISKGSSKARNFQNLKVVIQSKLPLLSSLVPLKVSLSDLIFYENIHGSLLIGCCDLEVCCECEL